MVSVDQWEQHFKTMANKAFPHEDMYVVNKGGRGIGRNSFPRTTYKIRKLTGPTPMVEIVSPMIQTMERAKALIEPIKGGNQMSNGSKKKDNRRGKVTKSSLKKKKVKREKKVKNNKKKSRR